MTKLRLFALLVPLFGSLLIPCYSEDTMIPRTPVIASDWWRICEMPDLGELNGPNPARQHVVDHGFIQAENGKWQLWACIRGVSVGRVLYGWEGDSLEEGPWPGKGVVARADEKYGEKTQPQEQIGAPFFLKDRGRYYCFYHAGGIRLMTSNDGISYERVNDRDGSNMLYPDGGRDVMVLKVDDTYYSYSTVSVNAERGYPQGFVILRTSPNLRRWSDYSLVCEGGRAGNGLVSAESPFVVHLDGYFYMFRSSSITQQCYVYRSEDPYSFCSNDDRKLIAEFPILAPEIIEHDGKWYISDLADFQGIKLARLEWEEDSAAAKELTDQQSEAGRVIIE